MTTLGAKPTAASGSPHLSSKPKNITKVATAEYPFNNSRGDADVILEAKRGTDVVRFYAHRAILRMASSFFDGMFSLPQPESSAQLPLVSSGGSSLPIVHMEERAETVDYLLRMCYPVRMPVLLTVATLSSVLGSAIKYQMAEPIRLLKETLMSFRHMSPLEVFAEACKHNLEDIAQHAAFAFCATNAALFSPQKARTHVHRMAEYICAMDNITATSYFHLLKHHAESGSSNIPSIPKFCSPVREPTRPSSCALESKRDPSQLPFDDPHHGNAVLRSSDNVNFYVDRHILAYASPALSQLLATSDTNGSSPKQPLEILWDSHTTAALLQLCYPLPDPSMQTRSAINDRVRDVCDLYEAASWYKVSRAQDYAKRACSAAVNAFPLRLYLIASHYGWTDVAAQSALRAIYELTDSHVPEMDVVRASVYRRFLVYRETCRNIILSKWYNVEGVTPQVGAEYWSQKPWLENTGEEGFWCNLHTQARARAQQVSATPGPPGLDVESILPSSLSRVLVKKEKATPASWGTSSGTFGTPIAPPSQPSDSTATRTAQCTAWRMASDEDIDNMRARQRALEDIAAELAKV